MLLVLVLMLMVMLMIVIIIALFLAITLLFSLVFISLTSRRLDITAAQVHDVDTEYRSAMGNKLLA